jgi:glycosyltransferase involved in cell wall biosynthesis
MKLTVVVPLFNEDAVIEDTNRRIIDLAGDLAEKRLINDYEIIYVDDGSTDSSLDILKKFAETSPKIKVL